jgi:hypothetical protein
MTSETLPHAPGNLCEGTMNDAMIPRANTTAPAFKKGSTSDNIGVCVIFGRIEVLQSSRRKEVTPRDAGHAERHLGVLRARKKTLTNMHLSWISSCYHKELWSSPQRVLPYCGTLAG